MHGVSGLALTVTLQAGATAAQISAPALAARPTLHRYLCGSFCEELRNAASKPAVSPLCACLKACCVLLFVPV